MANVNSLRSHGPRMYLGEPVHVIPKRQGFRCEYDDPV